MSKISEISLCFPEKTFTNEDFFNAFPDERDSKTWKRLGIEKRHVLDEGTVPSDLGLEAAKQLISEQPSLKDEIDFILFTSPKRDYYTPVTSGIMQDVLGIKNECGCMDVHQGCSSFIYLLSHADGLIQINAARKVLIIAVSTLTREIHEKDKANRFIFGDAACAMIVEKSNEQKIHSYFFGNDGSKKDKIIIKDGEYRNPLNNDSYTEFINDFGEKQIPAFFYQDGAGVFRFTLDRIPKMINSILDKNQLKKEDIDLYLLHQPNEFIVKSLSKIAALPAEKVVIDVKDYGNTVSVSIPIMIHNLQKQNKIKKGMKILIAGFGTGLSWNGCIWET